MSGYAKGPAPIFTFLTPEDREKIHQAALRVLDETGMAIMHDGALALLREAGCPAAGPDGRVRIPPGLVQKALRSAPSNVAIYDRRGRRVMDLGGRRTYFGTGSDLMYRTEGCGPQRHTCSLEDVRSAARVADALDNIDFIMSFAHPNEIAPQRAYLESFTAMMESSVKPIVCTAEGRDDLSEMWEIARLLRGGDEPPGKRPYWIQYAEPISPLKHPFDSLDKLLFCAQTGMPVIYSPAPIAGSTAPMSIAGHVTQGLAESICGLVIHQLQTPGAPFLMGMGAAVLDMASGQCSYNAPEYLMAYIATVEMCRHFDLPNWGYGGTSDSQLPDGQAVFEGGLLCFLSAMAGSNLNHDVGYLDFGLCGSLELMAIMDEIIDQVRRMQCGIPIDSDTLALEVIGEAGPRGEFLTHPHTMQHLRSTQWRPRLISRQGNAKWQASGAASLLERAAVRVAEILETHRPAPVPAEPLERIRRRVADYKSE